MKEKKSITCWILFFYNCICYLMHKKYWLATPLEKPHQHNSYSFARRNRLDSIGRCLYKKYKKWCTQQYWILVVALCVLIISRGGGRTAIHRALERQSNGPENNVNLQSRFNLLASRTSNTAKQSMPNSTDREPSAQSKWKQCKDMSIGKVLKRKKN